MNPGMRHACHVVFSARGAEHLEEKINEAIAAYEADGWTLCAESLVIAPGSVDPIIDDALYALLTFQQPRED